MAIDMHAKGVFHQDIKLENAAVQFWPGEPRGQIIDFVFIWRETLWSELLWRSYSSTPPSESLALHLLQAWFIYKTVR